MERVTRANKSIWPERHVTLISSVLVCFIAIGFAGWVFSLEYAIKRPPDGTPLGSFELAENITPDWPNRKSISARDETKRALHGRTHVDRSM